MVIGINLFHIKNICLLMLSQTNSTWRVTNGLDREILYKDYEVARALILYNSISLQFMTPYTSWIFFRSGN